MPMEFLWQTFFLYINSIISMYRIEKKYYWGTFDDFNQFLTKNTCIFLDFQVIYTCERLGAPLTQPFVLLITLLH
jgi:hypothetical protein